MSVIKLSPAYKDYLWGGERLKQEYNKQTDMTPLAESWEISTHPDGESIILNGPYKGETLSSYISSKGREILGTRGLKFESFPILVKFIDAKQDLSIQVHPNDEYGLKHEKEYGKTEMWIILEADKDSKLYYGVKEELTQDEFALSIEQNTILEKLNHVTVDKGDVIFVEAGTIHAIGSGIVLCEIQQNSNTTYRVYDFDRVDIHGNKRDLHIQQAIDVSNLKPLNTNFDAEGNLEETNFGSKQLLKTCYYFTVYENTINKEYNYKVSEESFEGIVVTEGTLTINSDNETVVLGKGESAFIDSGSNVELTGNAHYFSISV